MRVEGGALSYCELVFEKGKVENNLWLSLESHALLKE